MTVCRRCLVAAIGGGASALSMFLRNLLTDASYQFPIQGLAVSIARLAVGHLIPWMLLAVCVELADEGRGISWRVRCARWCALVGCSFGCLGILSLLCELIAGWTWFARSWRTHWTGWVTILNLPRFLIALGVAIARLLAATRMSPVNKMMTNMLGGVVGGIGAAYTFAWLDESWGLPADVRTTLWMGDGCAFAVGCSCTTFYVARCRCHASPQADMPEIDRK